MRVASSPNVGQCYIGHRCPPTALLLTGAVRDGQMLTLFVGVFVMLLQPLNILPDCFQIRLGFTRVACREVGWGGVGGMGSSLSLLFCEGAFSPFVEYNRPNLSHY